MSPNLGKRHLSANLRVFMMRKILLLLLFLFMPLPLSAEEVRVGVVEGNNLTLSTGEIIHLPGLYAPKFDLTRQALDGVVMGVALQFEPQGKDRWGRRMGALTTPDKRDIALLLVQSGAAQLLPEELAPTKEMIVAEDEARRAHLGLWSDECCRVIGSSEAEKHTDQWRIVTGRVVDVAMRGATTYVNFDQDWRNDFTLILPKRLATQLKAETWKGQMIEARGWIGWNFGPAISPKTAAQIRLPDTPAQAQ